MFRSSFAPARSSRSNAARLAWENLWRPSEMERLLRRETARADRTGRGFSLILFPVKAGPRQVPSTYRLARALIRRARVTDEVGWFSEQCLCALLSDTPSAGARIFAARVCDLISRRAARPSPVIYTYAESGASHPPHALQRRELIIAANGNGNGHDDVTSAEAHASGNGNGHGNGNGNGHAILPQVLVQRGLTLAPLEPGLDSQSVQELLVCPLPLWKRVLDVLGAAIGLVVFCPLMGLAAAGIRLTSPGPVIFRQHRSGLGGRPFVMYKFRTMVPGADAKKALLRPLSEQDGPAFKMEEDPRLTRFGRFLRKSSIDELPQLWNVLKGDMSLVGPRPLPMDESAACLPWQRRRLDITPGLTCIWQVEGRSRVTFDEWVRMDVAYMRRRTPWRDLWIMLKTIPAVLLRRGAR